MNSDLQPLPESESVHVREFLREVFQSSSEALFVSPAHMHWKFWEPREDWAGPRSYAVLDDAGKIVAHAGAWPFSMRTTEGTVAGLQPFDWAADKTARGAGAILLKQVRVLREICCCVGGTDIAQAVVKRAGFSEAAKMRMLVRPLRPLRQFLTHQRRDWKRPARLLRNAAWVARGASVPAGWAFEPIQPSEIPPVVLPSPASELAVPVRSAAQFAYMLKCPIAHYQLYLVRKDKVECGYFVLSFVPGQARVADAWVVANDTSSWRALYALAVRAALQEGSTAEISIYTSLPQAFEGAVAGGFRAYDDWSVMLYDPNGRLAKVKQVHLQMLDNDMSFLHEGRVDYAT